jgi:hypothetical protein
MLIRIATGLAARTGALVVVDTLTVDEVLGLGDGLLASSLGRHGLVRDGVPTGACLGPYTELFGHA